MRCEAKTARIWLVKKAKAWGLECSEKVFMARLPLANAISTGTEKRRKSSESHWKSSDAFVYGRVVFENGTPKIFDLSLYSSFRSVDHRTRLSSGCFGWPRTPEAAYWKRTTWNESCGQWCDGNILPGGGATHRWYQCKDFGLSPSQEIGRGISHHCRPQGFLRSVFQGCGYKPPFAATAK